MLKERLNFQALKTYQICQTESCAVETKFRAAEQQKLKFEESYPLKVGNSRKHRFLEKEFEKVSRNIVVINSDFVRRGGGGGGRK